MQFTDYFKSLLGKELKAGNTPLLLGAPGIGKSSIVEALAEDMHTAVFTVPCNQLADKADLTGSRLVPVTYHETVNGEVVEVQDYEQKFYPHTAINQAIHYAKENKTETPILFMDEINRTTQDVTSACLSLVTSRSIGCRPLPDNLKIILAGNDKGNVIPLDTASITRFEMFSCVPDITTYLNLDQDLNPFIKNVLTQHPDTLMGKGMPAQFINGDDSDADNSVEYNIEDILDDGTDMYQMTTPRTISYLSRFLNECTNDELKSWIAVTSSNDSEDNIPLLQEILEAHTGKTPFTTFLFQEIINGVNTIQNQGTGFKVPKPNIYDTLAGQKSISELIDFIDNMSNRDKSGCLVYALSQKGTKDDIIIYLTKAISKMEGDDTNKIGRLFSDNIIPDENINVFFNVDAPISNVWKSVYA